MLLVFIVFVSEGQTVSPYQLSTSWAFGSGGRMEFSGDFPSSSVGVTSTMGTNNAVSPETSTAIAYRSKTRALYTNTLHMFNNNPLTGGTWLNLIYNMQTNNICSGSAAGGGVLFPDPVRNSTNDAFYMINANDLTGGSCQNKGLNRTRYIGLTLPVFDATHGIVNVDTDANNGEGIAVGADRSGGYWLAGHTKDNTNTFRIWHYTATGITGPVVYDMLPNFTASALGQSYIKFSPCNDKIAFTGANWVVIYNFDNINGTIGSLIWGSNVGVSSGDGLEFSPDGDRIYWSGNNTNVDWHDITSNTNGTTGSKSWTMQLGLDGNIYASPGTSTSLTRFDNANNAPTVNSVTINGGGSVYRGLTNLAWLSPNLPILTAIGTGVCNNYDFTFAFKNYYNTNVSIKSTEATIDFNDGSPIINNPTFPLQHTFPTTGGPYIVTYTFKDLFCDQVWKDTAVVIVTCPSPIELIDFIGFNIGNKNQLYWSTKIETDFNYFILEKSNNGKDFYKVDTIHSKGNNSNYGYLDNANSQSYYRLKIVDNDGTYVYSNTIVLNYDNYEDISIYPNPSKTNFTINSVDSFDINVYTVDGKLIYSKDDSTNLIIGDEYETGTYMLKIKTKNKFVTKKIIKQQ